MPKCSHTPDQAELARYDAMAARAFERQADLWDASGILTGAAVVDLGCGPGAFLAALATRTGPSGTVVGVDGAEHAVAAAQALVDRRGLGQRVPIVHAGAQHTGLEPASFDVVFIGNLLVRRGRNANRSAVAHVEWRRRRPLFAATTRSPRRCRRAHRLRRPRPTDLAH